MKKRKTIPWENYATEHYQGNYECCKCGEVKFCKGTRRDKLRCKECYNG